MINFAPYLHQFDKNEKKLKKKIVKLKRTTHEKQNNKCVEYSEEKQVIDKLIDHEENVLHQNNSLIDDIDRLVARNKYIKLII